MIEGICLLKKTEISATKGESLENKLLEKALTIFYDSKKDLRKEVRSFFPKRFKTDINKDPEDALINAIYLYNSKNKINKSFEDKNINLSDFPYNAKLEESELELESESESESESKLKFEESIGERTNLRRQESDKENQKGQGLKILTLEQMLSRLLITLAQLKAGNDSQELKNEVRELLYSLPCSKKLSKTIYKHLISSIQKWKQYLRTL